MADISDDAIETASRLLGLYAEKYQPPAMSKEEEAWQRDAKLCPCNQCIIRRGCRNPCFRFGDYVSKLGNTFK